MNPVCCESDSVLSASSGILFAPRLNRAALASLPATPPVRIAALHVLRNHAVEHALGFLPVMFSPWRLKPEPTFGPYDDSLALTAVPSDQPILVWLDFSRFDAGQPAAEFHDWFFQRIAALRALTTAPIVVVDALDRSLRAARLERIPGVELFSLAPAVAAVGPDNVHDLRAARFSGTPYSSAFLLEVARTLAAGPLARAFGIGLKAVVCDLDHTLYEGVLGEDGPEGVALSEPRRLIQERLRTLREQGMLLAVLSRNTPEDVGALFSRRRDFPLQPEDFAAIDASWDPKSVGFGRILERLRIGPDTVLFLDDNPGELLAVGEAWPSAHLLPAHDAALAARALAYFPGIGGLRAGDSAEAALRTADLQANIARESASRTAATAEDYFRALAVRLEIDLNAPATFDRLAELSQKTNQFNLALRRLSAAEVRDFGTAPGSFAVAIALRDRFSDSGIVAGWCGRLDGARLVTEDLVISCRALGRRLEDILFAAAFRFVAGALGASEIALPFREGPRNQPALRWLESFAGAKEPGVATVPVPALPATAAHVEISYRHHA